MSKNLKNELSIRKRLSEQLGVEFCTDAELTAVAETAEADTRVLERPAPRQQTISEIIVRCNEAAGRMGATNPHKWLVLDCAFALRQLCDRLWALEHPEKSDG